MPGQRVRADIDPSLSVGELLEQGISGRQIEGWWYHNKMRFGDDTKTTSKKSDKQSEDLVLSDGKLNWTLVDKMLATGLSVDQVGKAAGITVSGLEAEYKDSYPGFTFDSIEVHAESLRVKQYYHLLTFLQRSVEVQGSKQSFDVLSKLLIK